jgi:hypothetical protein
MTKRSPTLAPLFDVFFRDQVDGQSAAAASRTRAVRAHLEAYLDEHADGVLTTGSLALLNAERQFTARGAFVRTMHADDLLFALPGYLSPDHRMPAPAAARSQVVLVGRLAQWLWTEGHLPRHGLECGIHELEAALSRARRELVATGTARR